MTEVLEQARQQVEFIQRSSGALTGETEGFLFFVHRNCKFVEHLELIWTVMIHRLGCGGAPAKLFTQECDLLLDLMKAPDHYLSQIDRVWHQRTLPKELAEPIYAQVQEARNRLASLARSVREVREQVPRTQPVSVSPEDLKQQITQTDEQQEWRPLRDVVTQMRQCGSSKQE
jgi:hypothetical protein